MAAEAGSLGFLFVFWALGFAGQVLLIFPPLYHPTPSRTILVENYKDKYLIELVQQALS